MDNNSYSKRERKRDSDTERVTDVLHELREYGHQNYIV